MQKEKLPTPKKRAIIFENALLYVCLASFPICRGHCVVVWKADVSDLHLLSRKHYEYLMDVVDVARNAILSALKIKKVYLMYMDEINHVHWHLIPRYNEKGINALNHAPKILKDFSLTEKIKKHFSFSQ